MNASVVEGQSILNRRRQERKGEISAVFVVVGLLYMLQTASRSRKARLFFNRKKNKFHWSS